MPAVSLTDVKVFLNITRPDDDDELMAMIDRAEAILVARVGPLDPVTVVEKHHGGLNPIVLRRPPVISVTSVVANGITTLAGFDLDSEAGLLYSEFGYGYEGFPRSVEVTYTAGRPAPLPADLEAAVLELVKHLWDSQRVPGASRPGFQGFGGGTGESAAVGGAGYLLPYRVQSLIEPYLRPGIA